MEQIVKLLWREVLSLQLLNFMLLKEMVEKIAGMPMDMYLDSVFYAPMGLRRLQPLPYVEIPEGRRLYLHVETEFPP